MIKFGGKFMVTSGAGIKTKSASKRKRAIPLAAALLLAQLVPVGAHPQTFTSPAPAGAAPSLTHTVFQHLAPALPPTNQSHNISSSNLTAPQLNHMLSSGDKTFILNSSTPILGNVVIPKGVTLIDYLSKASPALSILGNLTDSGQLFLASAGSLKLATLNANNIYLTSSPS